MMEMNPMPLGREEEEEGGGGKDEKKIEGKWENWANRLRMEGQW